MFKKILSVLLIAVMITSGLSVSSFAKDDMRSGMWVLAKDNPELDADVKVYSTYGGEQYLFLPRIDGVESCTLILTVFEGFSFAGGRDLISSSKEDNKVVFNAYNGAFFTVNGKAVRVMQGSLPSMHISVSDGYSIDEIHLNRDVKIKASVKINGTENDQFNLKETEVEMKTRGYSTFAYNKKPYQIKFDKKTDLFDMGKAKKWVLLANYVDGTEVRNKVIFDLGEEIGCAYTPQSVFIDLYIDGNYVGVYQLTEKTEIGSSRVDLKDDYGVLLEMDCYERLEAGDIAFRTSKTRKAFVYKDYVTDFENTEDPDVMEKVGEIKAYVERYINKVENALYAPDAEWSYIESLIDVDSFVKYYFITEYSEEVDATFASTFFYLDGKDDVLHCAPLWDYDRCLGWNTGMQMTDDSDFLKNMVFSTDNNRVDWFKNLFRHPEFVRKVNDFYTAAAKDAFDTEKVCSKIEEYKELIWNSLMMNYALWRTIFITESNLGNSISGGFSAQAEYAFDYMESWAEYRKEFLDTAYGNEFPVLSYAAMDQYGYFGTVFTGGCISGNFNVAGLKMNISDTELAGGIRYSLFYAGKEYSASNGEKIVADVDRFTGLSVRLQGNVSNYFTVEYRVFQPQGISSWTRDGLIAGQKSGSVGFYGISGIQVRLIQKKPIEYASITVDVLGEITEYTGIRGNTMTLPVPKKIGYEFKGWYYDPLFNNIPIGESVLIMNQGPVIYAKMEKRLNTPGDANGDGEIDMKDLLTVRRFTASVIDESEIIYENADVNGDGDVDMKDLLSIRMYIAGVLEF